MRHTPSRCCIYQPIMPVLLNAFSFSLSVRSVRSFHMLDFHTMTVDRFNQKKQNENCTFSRNKSSAMHFGYCKWSVETLMQQLQLQLQFQLKIHLLCILNIWHDQQSLCFYCLFSSPLSLPLPLPRFNFIYLRIWLS